MPRAPEPDVQDRALEALVAQHAHAFERRFGPGAPVRSFFAPGRVNIMGAHLDYNGGPVMPMALDRGTFIALRPRGDGRITLASTLEEGTLEVSADRWPSASAGRWYDYPLGVITDVFTRTGLRTGADVLFGGNLPIGAGLSSSASICVGTAFAFRAVLGLGADPMACIESALWGERRWVGVQCGIMDPFAVALSRPGHVLWLECREARFEHIPFDAGALQVAVIDSGIRRELARGEFNRRVEECKVALGRLRALGADVPALCDVSPRLVEESAGALDPVSLRRARHVTGENLRTRRARDALLKGDLEGFGTCVSEAHVSLRDLYEVSVPELDRIVASALEVPGVLGGRLTGAGFGGCAVVLFRGPVHAELEQRVRADFERDFGRRPAIFFFRGDPGPREYA